MDAWIDWLHAEKLANDQRCAASKPMAHMHAHHDHRTYWLERIRALPLPPKIRIMNGAAAQERAIAAAACAALPEQIELIAGPGCPVCICPEEDVTRRSSWLCRTRRAAGVRRHVARARECAEERAALAGAGEGAGADIRPIASLLEAVRIAEAEHDRTVVLFATGFETTIAPVAAMLMAKPPPIYSCCCPADSRGPRWQCCSSLAKPPLTHWWRRVTWRR